MLRKRSILSLLLALVATVLISCGGANENTPPPTYSNEQIEQIQRALTPVKQARKRLRELEPLLNQQQWSDASSLLHGPLGGLRREMSYVTRNLLPKDQEKAKDYAKALFQDLEKVDAALEREVASRALQNYDRALNDFDNYLSLIPDQQASENRSLDK
ncbi:MAG: photosystem II protein PsbQ [Halothece sp.]